MEATIEKLRNSSTKLSMIDGQTAFTELVRASISAALKIHGVEIPEHSAAMASKIAENPIVTGPQLVWNRTAKYSYETVEHAFRWNLDLFETHQGPLMERELFGKLGLTADQFKEPAAFKMVTESISNCRKPLQFGTVIAYVAFLIHVCLHRAKSGAAIDEAYMQMLLDSLLELPKWDEICTGWIFANIHYIVD
jgi:hypothetical protein